ncbi:MAG: DUF5320 domain-containing protein [Fretibacterium sp.]|nr:DUF5320 domain-containing protein [Fretibacterium sp.]
MPGMDGTGPRGMRNFAGFGQGRGRRGGADMPRGQGRGRRADMGRRQGRGQCAFIGRGRRMGLCPPVRMEDRDSLLTAKAHLQEQLAEVERQLQEA